jgi:AAA domain
MTPSPYDAWNLSRVLSSKMALNGELATMAEAFRPIAEHLGKMPLKARDGAFQGYLMGQPDRNAIIQALADADPLGPAPSTAFANANRSAHLGDLTSDQSAGRFIWLNWIVRAHFTLLSSDPKIGKTHFALDLARRLWLALNWPDGQPATFPEGTTTLWICGDRHQDELRERAAAFGLPPEAVRLNARPDNPYGGWDLDDDDNVKLLADLVAAERPGLVFIDTVWRATKRRLSKEEEVNALMTPIVNIAQECGVSIMGLMHLSKEQDTLGRRLEGLARGIVKLFRPDPGQPNRRRLEVIGNFKEPPHLGVTLHDAGCDFDSNPPMEPSRSLGGRPDVGRQNALEFLRKTLAKENDQRFIDVRAVYEASGQNGTTLWRALKDLEKEGAIVCDGKPSVMHLIKDDPDGEQPY